MGVFDNFKEVNGKIVNNQWNEWVHFNIPNEEDWQRALMQAILRMLGCCDSCVVLDGCYFVKWNMPKNPVPNSDGLLHPNCHCIAKDIPFSMVKFKATALCSIRKFTEYAFRDDGKDKGKKEIYTKDLGYSIEDSDYLKDTFEKQALQQYLLGNYKLKDLDDKGQRLAIPVELNGKKIYTGWVLHPEGLIINATIFAGWVDEK